MVGPQICLAVVVDVVDVGVIDVDVDVDVVVAVVVVSVTAIVDQGGFLNLKDFMSRRLFAKLPSKG